MNSLAPVALTSAFAYLAAKTLRGKRREMEKPIANLSVDLPKSLKDTKYPAKLHNANVQNHLNEKDAAFLICGNHVEGVKYCDISKPFRQERYFYYLSGVDIPNSTILYLTSLKKLILFLPDVNSDDIIWSGMPMSIEEASKKFDVDEVHYLKEFNNIFRMYENDITKLYTTDLDNFKVNESVFKSLLDSKKIVAKDEKFFNSMDEARLIKDEYEIEILRYASKINDNCHLAVMSALPIELTEYQIQAEFEYHALRQGSRTLGYDPICCSGPACGTLHYVTNTEELKEKESVLIDSGCEWMNYTTDVTRCFPINGKFTKEHREIYEAVLDMQAQTMSLMKPGARWEDLHILSHKVLIKHLMNLGILRNEFTEDEIFESKVTCAFYPHGLGHLMGLDVHDVAGKPNYEDPNPYFAFLRLRRELKANMVVTNEPGCYFNEFLMKEFLEKYPERTKMVNFDVLKKYMYVGGVRIEDDILITKDGHENLTGITSDPDEIEKIVSKGLSKSRSNFHVVV
ncbi:hypothetical protein KAFR_0B01790 [Kazachstania africana CBS 2517]|uniref:Aminopeptidase P N-terminal domain-containing protein n=1 Tax=Kazachstania africana (strain ATCC 22294 / BCRC 22015 / CBS 2517 / CECT 1963 / NBRC 1671 / NRRL Y-8276) TaxID=1071382 RepID=H2AQ28_KAZAF|nr:hypothetical protein KAFR_0B01790 [Kazachstania africana CBS 2517]CCF56478.1 hypothetical protein KAFR_0B01790 [Kazachstania africana CBS 2517]